MKPDFTSVDLWGLRVDEPVTVLTDLVISAVCFYAVYAIRQYKDSNYHKLYFGYFITMGIATAIGGIVGHGFMYTLSLHWKLPAWLLSMISMNLIERIYIRYTAEHLNRGWANFFSFFNIAELFIFGYLAFSELNFKYVEYHTAYGILVVVLGFSLYNSFRGRHRYEIRMNYYAVFFSIVAGLYFIFKPDLWLWFNYMDASHILLALSAWYFFRSAQGVLARSLGHEVSSE